MAGSSYYDLPRVAHWFTGNIGYHHIHHLSSRVPNYRLRACFEACPPLQAARRLTFVASLRCARLKLWDEDAGRMVGFGTSSRPQAEPGPGTAGWRGARAATLYFAALFPCRPEFDREC